MDARIRRTEILERERVVRNGEARIEELIDVQDGEGLLEMVTEMYEDNAPNQNNSNEAFACGRCKTKFGGTHRLFLVRHREWNVDECSNCGEAYQIGRAKDCPARLRAHRGNELEMPLRAWLTVNELLHAFGLISVRQYEAMELDIGAGPDLEQAEWISDRLREDIDATGGTRSWVERETTFSDGMAEEFCAYLEQFMRFARECGGFSVY